MTQSFWEFLFGARHNHRPTRASRHETVQRLEGLMREREQIDQSGDRWRERMRAEIRRYAALSEEAVETMREEADADGHPE